MEGAALAQALRNCSTSAVPSAIASGERDVAVVLASAAVGEGRGQLGSSSSLTRTNNTHDSH